MKRAIIILQSFLVIVLLSSFNNQKEETYALTIEVNELRNSKGAVQCALYSKDGSIPDENFKKSYRIIKGRIIAGSSEIVFYDLPAGKYAVNILHDENNDGKINKGIIFPKEGIGFSNFESIGFSNQPSFAKASFNLQSNKKIKVKIIYL